MLVEVLKEKYLVVLSENPKDLRWLNQAGYIDLGEGYYQEIFNNIDELIEELNYLIAYGAEFDDQANDEDSPLQVLNDLKAEGYIK